ncbi:MAG: hypothetical protein QM692_05660 [Thermomicrobiales bacterium]
MSALRHPTPPLEAPPTVAALPSTSREVLDAVRAAYTFIDADDEALALSILTQRPDIATTLLEALPHVATIFGEGTPVFLVTVDDHTGDPITLSARVVTSAALPEAMAQQLALYRTWWNDASGPIFGDLSFGLTSPRRS